MQSPLNSDEFLFDFKEFSINNVGAHDALLIQGAEANGDKTFVADSVENFLFWRIGATEKEDFACAVLAGDSGH